MHRQFTVSYFIQNRKSVRIKVMATGRLLCPRSSRRAGRLLCVLRPQPCPPPLGSFSFVDGAPGWPALAPRSYGILKALLSVCPHFGQSKARLSNPGFPGSERAKVICAEHFGQLSQGVSRKLCCGVCFWHVQRSY
jgi:hypothetical protein